MSLEYLRPDDWPSWSAEQTRAFLRSASDASSDEWWCSGLADHPYLVARQAAVGRALADTDPGPFTSLEASEVWFREATGFEPMPMTQEGWAANGEALEAFMRLLEERAEGPEEEETAMTLAELGRVKGWSDADLKKDVERYGEDAVRKLLEATPDRGPADALAELNRRLRLSGDERLSAVLDDGEVIIFVGMSGTEATATPKQLLDWRYCQGAIIRATDAYGVAGLPMTAGVWRLAIAEALGPAVVKVEGRGQAWVSDYLQAWSPTPAPNHDGAPFVEQGRVHVFPWAMKNWLRNARATLVTDEAIRRALKSVRCEPHTRHVTDDEGERTTRRTWILPADFDGL